jgi:hypothetical protein
MLGNALDTSRDKREITATTSCPVVVSSDQGWVTATPLGRPWSTSEALGAASRASDLNGDGIVNVVGVQIEINTVLVLGCAY